ncbi:MAG: hypothetical protein LBQ97_02530 [Fusobacteriaceae bacterium]|jgi:hypothetical protein|nr:hypothetical protein [Fusobacteriaceae bacterium]
MTHKKHKSFRNLSNTVVIRYEFGENLIDICRSLGCNYSTAAHYLSKVGAVKGRNAQLVRAKQAVEAITTTAKEQRKHLADLQKIHENLITELKGLPVIAGMKTEMGIKARADAIKVAIENAQKLYNMTMTEEEELKRRSDYLKYMQLVSEVERGMTETDIDLSDLDRET